MPARKKTDVVQLSKIRMREALRAKLARDAEKKGITLNAEIVDRLERSYDQAARDAAIIDMLVDHDDVKGKIFRRWGSELVKRDTPNVLTWAERIQRAFEVFDSAKPGDGDDK